MTRSPWRWLKRFIQRGIKGWSNEDTWSFDHYLAKVIRDGLKDIKKYKYGIPCAVYEENQTDEQMKEKWNIILDKMINTFDTAYKIGEHDWIYMPSDGWDQKLYEEWMTKQKENHWLFQHFDYHNKSHVMTLEESKEFEEGFDLFKKYYFSLYS